MSPEQITIDCSIPESNAIRATFGENCRIQLCLFHVTQCWSRNLSTKVKNSPGQHSNAKVVRGNIMSDLQSIIYETSCETVVEINEVENDMKLEEARVSSEVGRMGPETRNRRKREMIAAAIPDDRMKEMITKESETTYNVESLVKKTLFENVSRMETLLSELDASSIPKNELLAPTAENDSSINATSILKTDIKLNLDSLRHLKKKF
ncbi:hypothetical protein G6F44_007842 [Rhizopus delemar]|nr:hypothetical protein G6F44_007842 [Rhizopus delemar]